MRARDYLGIGLGIAAIVALFITRPPQQAIAQGPAGPVKLVGLTAPSHRAAIGAEQSGTIVEMMVREGARIRVGDVLFRLSSRLQELEVERLTAIVESELESQRATKSLEYARLKSARMQELSEQNISAQSSLQEAEFESELARLSLNKTAFERMQRRNELLQAKEKLSQRTLRSPLNGVVTRRIKQVGETPEQLEPVVEVMSLDPLWIQFECPVAKEDEFPLGGLVRVQPVIGRYAARLAKIVHVSTNATVAGHTFMVRASLANEDYKWRSGLKMRIESVAAEAAPAPTPK